MANTHTEAQMVESLFQRYSPLGQKTKPGHAAVVHQYVCASHVRSGSGWDARRTADFIVFDTCNSRGEGLAFTGHEIKVSRADWLSELKDPEKSAEFIQHCDYWYLVVSDASIVKDGELPENWGLMVLTDIGTLRVKKKAKRLKPVPVRRYDYPYGQAQPPVDRDFLTSFLRRVQKQAYEKGLKDMERRIEE